MNTRTSNLIRVYAKRISDSGTVRRLAHLLVTCLCAMSLSAPAQSPGTWNPPSLTGPSVKTENGAPKNAAVQTHRQDGADAGSMNLATPRGMYQLPQGARELWPDCEVAIEAMRGALALPTGVPAVVVVADTGPRGYYSDGVITVRKDADCSVLVHELVHHAQFLRLGAAKSPEEWHRREYEAKRIEQVFRNNDK